MRELATQGERKYLPKNPRESLEAYQRRVDVSVFHNAVELTVEGLTGMVFRRPIVLGDDVPPEEIVIPVEGGSSHGWPYCYTPTLGPNTPPTAAAAIAPIVSVPVTALKR
jgi:hypothetical protein